MQKTIGGFEHIFGSDFPKKEETELNTAYFLEQFL